MKETPNAVSTENVKACCARLYESDVAKLLFGDSFHPGGLRLTERLGELLSLGPESRVLDVASGRGTSALFLAERFGCVVIGVDFGGENVRQANDAVQAKGFSSKRIHFQQGDAESLPFPSASFDAIVCECAFCAFPNKICAAAEFARVMRPGGRVGLSDLTRSVELSKDLNGLLAWISCIADAQAIDDYLLRLCLAGFEEEMVEPHDDALADMVRQVQSKLLGIEIAAGLKKIDIHGLDLSNAKQMARAAQQAVQRGQLGYAIVTARKPAK